jgi:hypothetical protein
MVFIIFEFFDTFMYFIMYYLLLIFMTTIIRSNILYFRNLALKLIISSLTFR